MSRSHRSLPSILLACILSAAPAFAHPGHDGHDLTWDFTGAFGHQGPAWIVLGLLLVGGLLHWARRRSKG